MHISEGILPAKVCLGGYAIAGLATWYSLRKINKQTNPTDGVPKAALLTAAFFVSSSIHIPIPPTSVHFVLNGLLGAVLGCYAFPAILIGLLFQAVMFGHGGLTTLGINAIIMGVPAMIAAQIFRLRNSIGKQLKPEISLNLFGFLAGGVGLGLAALLFLGLTILNIPSDLDAQTEQRAILGLMIAHIPLMGIEGVFTAMVVSFLYRVKPELLPS
ncbi:MAG: cobalt transporter CbiM [Cyanobacteriota bacterium]|nr:cobalt transporter CbiM [Cyanobacteriota bacterium]